MATDPDADRLGVAVKNSDGAYEILTGNRIGALMLEYFLMNRFRDEKVKEMAGIEVAAIEDYSAGVREDLKENYESQIVLPKSNVLKYHLADGSWCCLRPSGTEPKAKFYFGVKSETLEDSKVKLEDLKQAVMNKVNEILS